MKDTQNDIPEIFSLQETIVSETNKIIGAICGVFEKDTLVISQIIVALAVQHNDIGEKCFVK